MEASDYSIPENWDRNYILDEAGNPVRVFDFGVKVDWQVTIGKQYELYDRLPDYGVEVWTYFSGWASLRDDKPPMFCTTISGSMSKTFYSLTWEEAEDKHRRVLAKIRLTLPRRD